MNQAHDFKRSAEIETVYVTQTVDFDDLVLGKKNPAILFASDNEEEGEPNRRVFADGCKRDESQALASCAGSEETVHPVQGWDAARPADLTLGHPELAKTALELRQFVDAESTDPNKHRFAATFERLMGIPAGLLRFEESARPTKFGRSFSAEIYLGKMFLVAAPGRSLSEAYDECLRLLRLRAGLGV